MPRKSARGGPRQGKIGTAYSNRTDLNQVTGLPYGEKQKLEQAQAATSAAASPTSPAPAAGDGGFAASEAAAQQALAGYTPSTAAVPLSAPSARPGEHVMTSPAQIVRAPSPVAQAVGLLNSLGANVPPDIAALRRVAAAAQMNQAAQ